MSKLRQFIVEMPADKFLDKLWDFESGRNWCIGLAPSLSADDYEVLSIAVVSDDPNIIRMTCVEKEKKR